MKNISKLFVAALVLVFAFTSCQKEGVYNPSKKIDRIYRSYTSKSETYINGSWQTVSNTEKAKYISEVWTWDGKLLKEIKHYASDGNLTTTLQFSYDGKRISTITAANSQYKFHYDGNKMKSIEHISGNTIEEKMEIVHDGNTISKIKVTGYYDDDKKGRDIMPIEVLRFIIPNAESASFEKVMARMQKISEMKGEYTLTESLEWDGKNVKKVTVSYDQTETYYIEYQYDDKKNPFYGLFNMEDLGGTEFLSKNNIKSEREIDGNEIYETNYNYTYDGKYPETKYYTSAYGNDSYRWTDNYTYYYEYK